MMTSQVTSHSQVSSKGKDVTILTFLSSSSGYETHLCGLDLAPPGSQLQVRQQNLHAMTEDCTPFMRVHETA